MRRQYARPGRSAPFAEQGHLFFAVAIVAILLAVSFAFSEGHLVLEVDFEDEDRADTAADKQGSKKDSVAASQKTDTDQGSKNQEPKAHPAIGGRTRQANGCLCRFV